VQVYFLWPILCSRALTQCSIYSDDDSVRDRDNSVELRTRKKKRGRREGEVLLLCAGRRDLNMLYTRVSKQEAGQMKRNGRII